MPEQEKICGHCGGFGYFIAMTKPPTFLEDCENCGGLNVIEEPALKLFYDRIRSAQRSFAKQIDRAHRALDRGKQ